MFSVFFKNFSRFFILSSLSCLSSLYANTETINTSDTRNSPNYEHKNIVVVTTSYNNKDWYKKNLDSIFAQDYDNYHVIYTDDCSPDGTGNLVEKYIQEKGQENKVTLIKNTDRKLALANIYNTIQTCRDTDIIVSLDGDDWFSNNHVLSYINDVYQNPNIWLTYGQHIEYPSNRKGLCRLYPTDIIEKNAFREFTWVASHLRTFYAGLFKQIKYEDLQYDGKFFAMTWDLAFMFPMLEMARNGHFKFLDKILYIYNTANVIADNKVSLGLQQKFDHIIRAHNRYNPIESYKPS